MSKVWEEKLSDMNDPRELLCVVSDNELKQDAEAFEVVCCGILACAAVYLVCLYCAISKHWKNCRLVTTYVQPRKLYECVYIS